MAAGSRSGTSRTGIWLSPSACSRLIGPAQRSRTRCTGSRSLTIGATCCRPAWGTIVSGAGSGASLMRSSGTVGGVGVSLDQQLASNLTAFVRTGIGRTNGDTILSHAWSTGLQLNAPFATRVRDRIGLAFSRQVEPGGSESIGEAYYSLFLTNRLAVSADLQWLFSGRRSEERRVGK